MLRTVGSTIRELRKNKNLTQEELAEAINVTPQAISKWENNIGLPDISQIIPLATFFGVSTDIIVGIAENNRNEEINEILNACNDRTLRKDEIESWLLIQDALKKYPSNLDLLQESIEYGSASRSGIDRLARPLFALKYASTRRSLSLIRSSRSVSRS